MPDYFHTGEPLARTYEKLNAERVARITRAVGALIVNADHTVVLGEGGSAWIVAVPVVGDILVTLPDPAEHPGARVVIENDDQDQLGVVSVESHDPAHPILPYANDPILLPLYRDRLHLISGLKAGGTYEWVVEHDYTSGWLTIDTTTLLQAPVPGGRIKIDASAGNVDVTLPQAHREAELTVLVVDDNGGASTASVTPRAGDPLNGGSGAYNFPAIAGSVYPVRKFRSDGSAWWIVGSVG